MRKALQLWDGEEPVPEILNKCPQCGAEIDPVITIRWRSFYKNPSIGYKCGSYFTKENHHHIGYTIWCIKKALDRFGGLFEL